MKKWLLLFALLLPLRASAEDCTCGSSTTFDWTDLTSNLSWGNCTESAGDTYTINSGCTVTIPQGTSLTGTGSMTVTVNSGGRLNINGNLTTPTAGGAISVQDGGTLIAEVTSTQVVITTGISGIDCQEGSTCRFSGKVRTWGTASPALLDEPSTTAYFQAGDIYPCPGDSATSYDCATDGQHLRFSYSIGTPTSGQENDWEESGFKTDGSAPPSSRSYFTDSFDAITTDDVMVFFDPVPSDSYTYPEVNQPYEIEAVAGSGFPSATPRTLDIDIRQGTEEASGGTLTPNYPLTKRDIRSGLLTSATTAAQRKFVFADATTDNLVTADMDMVGRWLRFAVPGATTAPGQDVAYVIAQAKENAGYAAGAPDAEGDDTLLLASKSGVPDAHSSGDRVWVGYGFRKGDPAYIMVPVRIVSADATDANVSPHDFFGDLTLRNVVFQRPGVVTIGSSTTTATLEDISHVWIQDPMDSDHDLYLSNRGGTVNQMMITSGNGRHGYYTHCTHGLTIQDSSIRHAGDDNFLTDDSVVADCVTEGTTYTSNAHFNRIRAEFQQGNWASGSFYDGQQETSTRQVFVSDGYCADCVTHDATGTPLFYPVNLSGSDPGILAQRIVVLGLDSGLSFSGSSGTTIELEDLISIGGITRDAAAGQNFYFIPLRSSINRFVIRDHENHENTSTALAAGSTAGSRTLKNGIFDNITLFGSNAVGFRWQSANSGDFTMQNVAIIDFKADGTTNTCSGVCAVIYANKGSSTTIENVGMSYRSGTDVARRYNEGLRATDSSDAATSDYRLGGILISNFTNTAGTEQAYNFTWNSGDGYSKYTYTGPICAWNNVLDFSADARNDGGNCAGDSCSWIESYATVIRDRAPEYANPYAGTFIANPSGTDVQSSCGPKVGVGAPGIRRQMWAASLAGLGPENLADPTLGGGGGIGWPRAY